MRRTAVLFVALLTLTSCGEEQFSKKHSALGRSLPNWATPEELELQKRVGPPSVARNRVPPEPGFRVPAEYEPTQIVMMSWADYTSILSDIAVYTAAAGAEVWAVGGPGSISGVPSNMYRSLNVWYDSVWARDYGPIGINESTGELGIIDTTYRHYGSRPNDDDIPCEIAAEAGVACYTTSLILDGGNFLTDGQGNLFMTRRTYEWNSSLSESQVDQYLMDYFGVDTIHKFDYAGTFGPADGTGHIDMFVKLLAPCKVLVTETNDTPFSDACEAAATYFENLECAPGQTYQVYRIPGWDSGAWFTYTNSLIVNQTVIMPSYNSGDNQAAKQIYEDALPGYTVEMINCDSPIWAGGSIHCITKEVPVAGSTGDCTSPADCSLPNVSQHDCLAGVCVVVQCNLGFGDCNLQDPDGCETGLGVPGNCEFCGDNCNFAHASGTCVGLSCQMGTCDSGWYDCNQTSSDGCEAQLGTPENCTFCGDTCSFTSASGACVGGTCQLGTCDSGFGNCNGNDADGCETTLGSNESCEFCGDSCDYPNGAGACFGGACQMVDCDPGYEDCNAVATDGCEAQLGSNQNCGYCNDACLFQNAEGLCSDGACTMGSCHSDFADCNGSATDGCETSLGTFENCGYCGDRCELPNAQASCNIDSCALQSCNPGFANCDVDATNGCETVLGGDQDCSGCGDDCTGRFAHASGSCQAGACRLGACEQHYGDCDGLPDNGCESSLSSQQHCGACHSGCVDGQACILGGQGYECSSACADVDSDGYADIDCGGTDCNDTEDVINPGAEEQCNGMDDNCDGQVDEGFDSACGQNDSLGCGCKTPGNRNVGGLAGLMVLIGLLWVRSRRPTR